MRPTAYDRRHDRSGVQSVRRPTAGGGRQTRRGAVDGGDRVAAGAATRDDGGERR
ncbi:hypothetical protein ACFO0N_20465 [Halobium salinum]|uniref:Uncharacterized protein n=1 Tax=Halobium salinum TaxID=1364940 RepID=A0ABD5PHC8_9EURY|nr:hypothetical protein [Halobium salinum]